MTTPNTPDAAEPWLRCYGSAGLPAWLARHNVAFACTTYQTAKLFLVGRGERGGLAVHDRTFDRAMGLFAPPGGQTFWLGTRFQLWRFENVLQAGRSHDGHDRLYVPRVGYTTGDLDAHDVVVEESGRVVFAATKFNCLATLDPRDSFAPVWRPGFVSGLVAEDRCHLNGVALAGGRARYVTLVAASDVVDAWRDRRGDGGQLIDTDTGEPLATGLCMPHSPRLYRGRIWLLNAGTGHLGSVDPAGGAFEPLAFCPGFLRGLAFAGDYAVVGLSMPRRHGAFDNLPLGDELKRRNADARCGLMVIDLRTGEVAEWLRFEGMVTELYDVAVLDGPARPGALGFKGDDIARIVSAAT